MNPDPREPDLAPIGAAARDAIAKAFPIRFLSPQAAPLPGEGREIWKALLAILVGLLFLEAWLSKRISMRRPAGGRTESRVAAGRWESSGLATARRGGAALRAIAAVSVVSVLLVVFAPFWPSGEAQGASLRFAGGPLVGILAAAIVGVFLLGRLSGPERKMAPGRGAALLALLRALALLLVFGAFAEPLYEERRTETERARIVFVLDRSASMGFQDREAPADERLGWAQALGFFPPSAKEPEAAAVKALRALSAAKRAMEEALSPIEPSAPAPPGPDPARALEGARAEAERALSAWREARAAAVVRAEGTASAADRAGAMRRIDAARSIVDAALPALRERHELQVLPPGDPGTLSPSTDLSGFLAEATRSAGGAPLGAVVLLSDFRNNRGADPAEAAARLGASGVPVYCVGLGTLHPPKDVAIAAVSAPRSVFEKEKADVEVRISAEGVRDLPVRISVQEGGRVVHAEDVVLAGGGRTEKFSFSFDPGPKGVHAFKVSVPVQPGEADADNNGRDATIKVDDGKIRVLVIETRPRWEYRYLERLFYRDERVSANRVLFFRYPDPATIHGPLEGMLPEGTSGWQAYDAVFLGDADPRYFTPKDQEALKSFVAEKGGGLVVTAGESFMPAAWRGTPLEGMLPVVLPPTDPDPATVRERFRAGFTVRPAERAADSPLLRIARHPAHDAETWLLLPPLFWAAPPERAKPGAEVLAEGVTATGAPFPLLVSQRYGLGRVLYVGTDETWRWRLRIGDRYHHRFWGQVLRWAVGSDAGSDLSSLRSDRDRYGPGETVVLEARLKNPDRTPFEGGSPVAILSRGADKPRRVALLEVPNRGGLYRGRAEGLASGEYKARLDVAFGSDAATAFAVDDASSEERLSLSLDASAMRRIAEASGGAALDLSDAKVLSDLLDVPPRRRTITTGVDLWDTPSFFLLVALLLTLEWSLRKRWGLP